MIRRTPKPLPVRTHSLDAIDVEESAEDSGLFSRSSAPENRPSQVQVSSDGKRRGRRRPRPGMEGNTIVFEGGKINKSLKRINKHRSPSLLKRFLSVATMSASKRQSSSGGSDTSGDTSGLDGSYTNGTDNLAEQSPTAGSSIGSAASPMFRSLQQIVRRNTGDHHGIPSVSPTSSGRWLHRDRSYSGMMTTDEYKNAQLRLQGIAEDLHRCGKTEQAIETWVEALELAEEQQDTIACKTQILCMLVILHLEVAKKQNEELVSAEFLMPNLEASETTNNNEGLNRRQQMMARRRSKLIRPGLGQRVHHQNAKRYLTQIIPSLVEPSWLGPPNKALINFFCQAEAWELAIMVSDQILFQEGEEPDYKHLATMHYQAACQKLDAQKNTEALQHLQETVSCMKKVPTEIRDTTLYLQVLDLLATEYQTQQRYEQALETFREQIVHSPAPKHAKLHCQVAQVYIEMGELDTALENIELAKRLERSSSQGIRSQVLQTKGDIYLRLGRVEESLESYQQALHETDGCPAEKAKLLYTLGRLCVKLNRVRSAITYFTRELEITKQELGEYHLSVSRVLHQLAKLYDGGLGEHKVALMKYNKALNVELGALHNCHLQVTKCANCNPETHRMCTTHATLHRNISAQIRETKRCQGRIHYKLGDFDKAMKIAFQDKEATKRKKKASN